MIHEATLSPRRLRTRERKTLRILEEAEGLLLESGLEGLTIQGLARRLDCSPGALYRYFDSKGAILAALLGRLVADLEEAFATVDALFRERGADLDKTSRALLGLLGPVQVYLLLFAAVPRRAALLRFVLGDPRALVEDERGRELVNSALQLLEPIAARFEEAVASGALVGGDSTARVLVLWSSLQGVVGFEKLRRYEDSAFATFDLGSELVEALLRGWGADREALGVALLRLEKIDNEHSLPEMIRRAVQTTKETT